MDFLNLATNRYSVRSFSIKPVEKDKLDYILKAGQIAPTAANFQPQRIHKYLIKQSHALNKRVLDPDQFLINVWRHLK